MIQIITDIFSYRFSTAAITVGVLVSLCSALLGVSLVLKRFSMIGDGLSHVGFGALAIAAAANFAPLQVAVPLVVASAFFLLRLSKESKIPGDAAIAIVSSGSLAAGIMIASMTGGMNTDISSYMFGSILAISQSDLLICCVLAFTVITGFVLCYNKIFSITFDESFAKATGTNLGLFNTLLSVMTALTIVVGMRIMGTLLISSLIIFPPIISMRLFNSFKKVTVFSAFIAVFCFCAGFLFSYAFDTPTGSSVVCSNLLMLILCSVLAVMKTKFAKKS